MNSIEEQTAAELRTLARRATPATTAAPGLAQQVLVRAGRPRRRRARVVLGACGGLSVAGLVAAGSLSGNGDYRDWTEPSGAMAPTVAISQTVLVGKNLVPQRGNVVLLRAHNQGESFETLSRVVGLPGDVVSCPAGPDGRCQAVTVSGHRLNEFWLHVATAPFAAVAVPAGHAFLLSDARDNAVDSRSYGPQPLDEVLGVVVARVQENGQREALPGAPPHTLPEGGQPIDPANPVPPARSN